MERENEIQATSELKQGLGGADPFKFKMGARVKGIFAGDAFTGAIITRMESHTGGNHYAIWGDTKFRGGERSEWMSERDLEHA